MNKLVNPITRQKFEIRAERRALNGLLAEQAGFIFCTVLETRLGRLSRTAWLAVTATSGKRSLCTLATIRATRHNVVFPTGLKSVRHPRDQYSLCSYIRQSRSDSKFTQSSVCVCVCACVCVYVNGAVMELFCPKRP